LANINTNNDHNIHMHSENLANSNDYKNCLKVCLTFSHDVMGGLSTHSWKILAQTGEELAGTARMPAFNNLKSEGHGPSLKPMPRSRT